MHPAPLSPMETRLRDFCRASGDWMWEIDAEFRYTWISDEIESATGTQPGALLHEPIADLPLLDSTGLRRAHLGQLHDLLRRRQPFWRAVTEKHTPRGVFYVSRSAVPVFDEDGGFHGYRGTARDVTAQVESARRSRSHDVLLRKLSSQVPGVIFQFRMDPQGDYSFPYASDGLRELFGLDVRWDHSASDAAMPFRALHPDDQAGFIDSIRASAQRLAPWQREYRIIRPDGDMRWLETHAAPERLSDGATLWHGFTADVTDRKQIELALRRSEERWALAADAAGIGIAEVALPSGLMEMDRRACANHGLPYPLGSYSLDQWLAAIHPDDRDAVESGLRHALETHAAFESRCRARRADGEEITLEITARGRYDAQGGPTGLVGTCRDVTAQAAVELLRHEKDAAERANRAKSEFLSRVSHELRTPLNGILGFAQLMALDRVDTLAPAQQRRLQSVVRAGRHLLGLINDVLELTRIEQEDFSVRLCAVNAGESIADCIALIQPLADQAGVRLPDPTAPATPAWVRADPRALEQVLMNLLSNAIKYNRSGGSVDVEVTRTGAQDAPRVRIALHDQGQGMSAQQQASLFQPFNRLGAEASRTEGTGLGLVISQRLVDEMGGTLRAQSQPGEGSTFIVELPACDAPGAREAPAAPPPMPPAVSPTGPRRVLYIEDEPLNMVLMEEVFRTQPDWTLLTAEDGETGERVARDGQPDLVLIDMNLPDTNGLALIRRLRADPATRGLRCIALSADAMREQIAAALAAGFDEYWTKPIDVHRVLSDLGRLLAHPQGPGASRSTPQ